MANFSQTHPQMAAKLADLIESGLDPEQIIQHFKKEDEDKVLEEEEGLETEVFPDEIVIISQALAYREATLDDESELYNLLNSSYNPEIVGTESFRMGENSVSKKEVQSLLQDPTYQWLIVEAPNGKGIEQDGVILGATCYSTAGLSRRNGEVEGHLGSCRYLAVLPRYHGFCVGRRLLERVEEAMKKGDCCKSMICIPSTRETMMDWVERRGYVDFGAIPYPTAALAHTLKDDLPEDLQLVRFIKDFKNLDVTSNADACTSSTPSATWHLKNKPMTSRNSQVTNNSGSASKAKLSVGIKTPSSLLSESNIHNKHTGEEVEVLGVD
mmetsp:Transcript_22310/g.37323  ORF Transcript_22310/g.37323 Transcript_22310/m.37323 type:complete len:326 (+) Transcript_22310:45-1022(+)